MPSLTIRHVTTYRCRQPVAFGEHRMMLRPRDSHDQRVIEARLEISPEPKSLRFVQDAFGNHVGIARNCKPRMPNWKGCRAKSDFAIFWRAPRSRWSFSHFPTYDRAFSSITFRNAPNALRDFLSHGITGRKRRRCQVLCHWNPTLPYGRVFGRRR